MHLNALTQLNPTVAIVALAVAAGVMINLLIALKIEVWRTKRKAQRDNDALRRLLEDIQLHLDSMQKSFEEAEVRAAVVIPPPGSRSGMNMNQRVEVARMAKHGEQPEQIAQALNIPKNEVELLLKIQRLTLKAAS